MTAPAATNQTAPDMAIEADEAKAIVESAVTWVGGHEWEILVALAASAAIYTGLTLLKRFLTHLKGKDDGPIGFSTLVGRTAARTGHIFMALVAARLVVGYTDPPSWFFNAVSFFFTVFTVYQCAMWAREFTLGLIERRAMADSEGSETLVNAMGLIRVLVTFALFAIATVMVLDNLGVNVTGLVAGLGIGGIAIGLAAQGIFSDLLGALSILFDKPFRKGDSIQYDQTSATVEHIGLKSTRLRSIDGETKVISNANLLQKEITNFRDIERRRYALPLGIIYQTPPEKAAQVPAIVQEVIESCGGEFQRAGFTGFGASSIDYEVFFYANTPTLAEATAIRHKIGMGILKRFNEEGLEFAYPTQTTFTAAPDGTMVYPYARRESETE